MLLGYRIGAGNKTPRAYNVLTGLLRASSCISGISGQNRLFQGGGEVAIGKLRSKSGRANSESGSGHPGIQNAVFKWGSSSGGV